MWPNIIESMYHPENPYDVKLTPAESAKKTAAFWYPTLVLNLDLKKALPEEGVDWLFVRVGTKQIKKGRFDLEAIICDEAGELIALSHHSCLILGADRNIRRTPSKI